MSLSNESIIALVALIVTCAPLSLFIYRIYNKRRRLRRSYKYHSTIQVLICKTKTKTSFINIITDHTPRPGRHGSRSIRLTTTILRTAAIIHPTSTSLALHLHPIMALGAWPSRSVDIYDETHNNWIYASHWGKQKRDDILSVRRWQYHIPIAWRKMEFEI